MTIAATIEPNTTESATETTPKKIGRPERFDEVQQKTYVGLVGVGLSRRQAAIYLGFSPSTISKRISRDPELTDRLRKAELELEFDLLQRMLRQGQHSWRATAWLLERIHPERYAKGKKAAAQPSLDEVFDRVVGIVAEEVADDDLRARLERRFSELAASEFEDVEVPLPEACDELLPQDADKPATAKVAPSPVLIAELLDRSAKAAEEAQNDAETEREWDVRRARERRKRRRQELEDAAYYYAPDQVATRRAARADLFNTSPGSLEKRVLNNICG